MSFHRGTATCLDCGNRAFYRSAVNALGSYFCNDCMAFKSDERVITPETVHTYQRAMLPCHGWVF